MLKRLTQIVSLFALALGLVRPADAKTDLEDCYGDRLEVVFPAYTAEDGVEIPAAHMALPNPNAWRLTELKDVEGYLDRLPCQPVPIAIKSATIMGIDPRLGHVRIPAGTFDDVSVGMIRILPQRPDGLAASSERQKTSILAEGVEVDFGFVRRAGTNTDAVSGRWLFPDHYRSGYDNRIWMRCVLTCSLRYGIIAESRLGFRYRFRVKDSSRQPDWIGIDNAIRSLGSGLNSASI